MQRYPLSPNSLLLSFWRYRHLVMTLVRRDVVGRYRGSVLGILWSFFHPLIMLCVFTFVFSVVFKARWGGDIESRGEFALILFVGLIIYNFFAECLTRAPRLIVGNPVYVKKVVFPLEILPLVSFLAALFHAVVSLVVWFLFSLMVFDLPPATVFFFPLLFLPLTFLNIGLSWFLASMGVYFRDVSHIVGIVTTMFLFLTPIFYPLSAVPGYFKKVIALNPLAFIVEQARDLLIFGHDLSWPPYLVLTVVTALIAWLGFAWFQKTRKGFADVL